MPRMPDIALVVCFGLPLLGAGVLFVLDGRGEYRMRDPLPALIAGAVFAAALLLPDRTSAQIEFLPWPSVRIFGSRLAFLVDQFTLPFIYGMALLAVAATLVGANVSARKWAMAFLLWGGSLLMIIAGNLVTLLVSWIVCELALIGASLMTRHSRNLVYRLAAGSAGAIALVLLASEVQGQPASGLQAHLPNLDQRWLTVFFAIGALRMGLYPLHLASIRETDAPSAPLVLGRIASVMAGLYLWFRALSSLDGFPVDADYLVIWGGLAVFISALATWGARGQRSLIPWVVGFELGVTVVTLGLTANLTGVQSTLIAGLEMYNLLFAGGVFGLGLVIVSTTDGGWLWVWGRGLSFLAMASLLGLPPTPGFIARWGLYRSAIEAGSLAAVVPVVVASGLLVAPLFAAVRTTTSYGRQYADHATIGLTILGLPLALLSAQPLFLAPILDIITGEASYMVMVHLVRATTSRMSAQILALIVVPVLAGYSLDRVHERWQADRKLESVWRFLSLDWLYDLLASTLLRAAIAVSILLTLLELGSGAGFALIAGLLLVLLVLRR